MWVQGHNDVHRCCLEFLIRWPARRPHLRPFPSFPFPLAPTGWNEALVSMRLGEVASFVLHPDKGYKSSGSGNSIPGNAVLIFEIELHEWDGVGGKPPSPKIGSPSSSQPPASFAPMGADGMRQRKMVDSIANVGTDEMPQRKPRSVARQVATWLPELLMWTLLLMLISIVILHFLGEISF